MSPPNRLLQEHGSSNPDYRESLDSRIKIGVAVAPWGMATGFWKAEDLKGVNIPTFYIAGDADTTAGYEEGTRAIYENAVNSDRYLLTFKGAGHSAAAPYPLPIEFADSEDQSGASHYTDAVWDTLRMNNIMQHFVTAYLSHHLQGNAEGLSYLDVVPDADEAASTATYWKGFSEGSAAGLKLEHLRVGE